MIYFRSQIHVVDLNNGTVPRQIEHTPPTWYDSRKIRQGIFQFVLSQLENTLLRVRLTIFQNEVANVRILSVRGNDLDDNMWEEMIERKKLKEQ